MNLRQLEAAARDQGWREEETRDGIMFYPPDKTQSGVLVHRNPTEQALKKTVSQMRQRGFVWPPSEAGRVNDA